MRGKKAIGLGFLLFCLVLAAYFVITFYFERAVKKQLDDKINELADFVTVEYEKLRVDILKRKIFLNEITLKPRFLDARIKIGELMFFSRENKKDGLSDIRFYLRGMQFDPGSYLGEYMRKIGYDSFHAYFEFEHLYDHRNHRLNVHKLKISADQMGEAAVSLRLNNIDLNRFETIPGNIVVILAMISGIQIVEGQITYKDNSLVTRLFETRARESRQPVQKFVDGLSDKLNAELVGVKDPDTRHLLGEIRKFIVSPDRIEIRIKPQKPLPLSRLYFLRTPEQAIEILGIQIESK